MTYTNSKGSLPRNPLPQMSLVVEQNPVLRENLKSILETAGLACQEASDGHEALSIIHQQPSIGLILSDFQMPRLDGLQLLNKLKRSPKTKDIPFIFITSHSSFYFRNQAMRNGAVAILYKPYTNQELFQILNRTVFQQTNSSALSETPESRSEGQLVS